MRRFARRVDKAEGRTPRTLREIDYLLGVNDETRMGALRFSLAEGGPFLAQSTEISIPPLVELPGLLAASDKLLKEEESNEDLRLLLAPGSFLGVLSQKHQYIKTPSSISLNFLTMLMTITELSGKQSLLIWQSGQESEFRKDRPSYTTITDSTLY